MSRQTLKKITPDFIWSPVSRTYWWWHNHGRHELARRTSGKWRANEKRLQTYQNRHQGKRCFILGNGPSLSQTDLSLLKDEFTFGLNRVYLLFPELAFATTYLVSVNDLVLEQCAEDLNAFALPTFVTWRARRWFADTANTLFLDTDYTAQEAFSTDLTGRVFEGFTVTFVALQLAYYMGFRQAILIGVDHNFQTQGPPNTTVVSTGDDPNHFSPQYFGEGFRWQLPDLVGSERAYHLADQAFRKAGREVIDATIGGKLTIFPKADYLSFFPSKKQLF